MHFWLHRFIRSDSPLIPVFQGNNLIYLKRDSTLVKVHDDISGYNPPKPLTPEERAELCKQLPEIWEQARREIDLEKAKHAAKFGKIPVVEIPDIAAITPEYGDIEVLTKQEITASEYEMKPPVPKREFDAGKIQHLKATLLGLKEKAEITTD